MKAAHDEDSKTDVGLVIKGNISSDAQVLDMIFTTFLEVSEVSPTELLEKFPKKLLLSQQQGAHVLLLLLLLD